MILNLFISSITGFTCFFDWVSRVDINESFINSYNFFWTTFLYLPSFFFLLLLINSILTSLKLARLLSMYLLIMYIIYNIEILDFLIINFNLNINNINTTSVNLLLTNNLNKYHPLIFYISVVSLLNLLYQTSNTLIQSQAFSTTKFSAKSYHQINLITTVNLFALFLGSWWALQEGTWGGWWNWDPSEVLGLLFTLAGLLYIHSPVHYLTFFAHFYRLKFITLAITISYLFIQLNFDLVSHNFGSKFFFFFNNNLFFLELSFTFFCTCFCLLYAYQIMTLNSILVTFASLTNRFKKRSNMELLVVLLYSLVALLVIFSFIPLINYFLWVYFHINSLNVIVTTNLIIILSLLGLILPFTSICRYEYLFVFLLVISNFPTLICISIFMVILTLNFNKWLHSFIVLIIIININTYNTQFIYWQTCSESSNLIFDSQLLEKQSDLYICGNYFIDKINLSQTRQGVLFNTWNTFYLINSPSLNTFNLLFNTNSFMNIYYLSSNWQDSMLFIETNYLNNLLDALIFTVLLLLVRISLRTNVVQYSYH